MVIRDIELYYDNIQESEKGELDRCANYQVNKLKNIKLNQAEQTVFTLSYAKHNEKLVLDKLESIKLILTSGHEYKVPNIILKPLIQKLKGLKPPNPENLRRTKAREKTGQGICTRED